VCGAGYRERSTERVNSRNGYRLRDWDTRAGSIELAIPKLRTGSYFPRCSRKGPPARPSRAKDGGVGAADLVARSVTRRRCDGLIPQTTDETLPPRPNWS